jgi:hypothetical protein
MCGVVGMSSGMSNAPTGTIASTSVPQATAPAPDELVSNGVSTSGMAAASPAVSELAAVVPTRAALGTEGGMNGALSELAPSTTLQADAARCELQSQLDAQPLQITTAAAWQLQDLSAERPPGL